MTVTVLLIILLAIGCWSIGTITGIIIGSVLWKDDKNKE